MGIVSAKGRSTGRRRRRSQLPGLPADRRADQPRQLGRRPREHEGRNHRHQRRDAVAGRTRTSASGSRFRRTWRSTSWTTCGRTARPPRAARRRRAAGDVGPRGEPRPQAVGGAIIGNVTPDSAADHAGLKRGDVILSFNGQKVSDINSLRNHVAEATPGSTATVVDQPRRLGEDGLGQARRSRSRTSCRRARARRPGRKAALGISVEKGKKGLVITGVNPDSRAADAGLQEGDVIQEVNRKAVDSVDDLRDAVAQDQRPPGSPARRTRGQTRFVTVRPSVG